MACPTVTIYTLYWSGWKVVRVLEDVELTHFSLDENGEVGWGGFVRQERIELVQTYRQIEEIPNDRP